jgi:hypothetical protein
MPCPWVYISPLWHKLLVVVAHRVDPILIYTWRNAMSLGVYFSLRHKLLVVVVAAPCRSHSDIYMEECHVPVYISPLWHKLAVVAAAAPADPILIYTWRNAMSLVYISPLWHKLLVVASGGTV